MYILYLDKVSYPTRKIKKHPERSTREEIHGEYDETNKKENGNCDNYPSPLNPAYISIIYYWNLYYSYKLDIFNRDRDTILDIHLEDYLILISYIFIEIYKKRSLFI